MKKKLMNFIFAAFMTVSVCACESFGISNNSKDNIMSSGASQVQLRSYQSRAFDTTDKRKTMRAVVATMQDLGFIIDQADESLGTVSGSKYSGYMLKLTVSVFPKGKTQMQVRANLQKGLTAVEDPKPYQDFYVNLEKAMFLTAHGVD